MLYPALSADEARLTFDFLQLLGKRNRFQLENKFLGIQTLQNPMDVWITQEILHETKPDFIIECGARLGGSAALWAMLLREINPTGRVISIDIEDRFADARKLRIVEERVEFLVGSSTDPAIVEQVKKRVGSGRALVIMDSLHTRDHVLGELRAYWDLVPVGGYMIVQDTYAFGADDGGGPAIMGIDAFLEENGRFVKDRERERFLITSCWGGYLKRIR